MDLTQITQQLITQSPIVGLLFYIAYSLNKKVSEKETRIESLHEELRQSEKDTIKVIEKITTTLDSLSEKNGNSFAGVVQNLRDMRDEILKKLEQ